MHQAHRYLISASVLLLSLAVQAAAPQPKKQASPAAAATTEGLANPACRYFSSTPRGWGLMGAFTTADHLVNCQGIEHQAPEQNSK